MRHEDTSNSFKVLTRVTHTHTHTHTYIMLEENILKVTAVMCICSPIAKQKLNAVVKNQEFSTYSRCTEVSQCMNIIEILT